MYSIDVKKNDVIILPSINFIAAANVASLFKGKIVFIRIIHVGSSEDSKNFYYNYFSW